MQWFSGVLLLACACGATGRGDPGSPPAVPSAGAVEGDEAEEIAVEEEDTEPRYSLDDLPREVPERGKIVCPEVKKVTYRGDVIRYHKPVLIYQDFQPHLARFEELVRDTAIEIYGRAPRTIRHLGTYNCRRIRKWPTGLSEHGLANAIDVEGFDFGPAKKSERKAAPAAALHRAFNVRVLDHWATDRGVAALHQKFLHTLAQRVIDEPALFRVILGPAEPGHHNHLHLDMAPWRIVNVF
jgi:hypothetical protein